MKLLYLLTNFIKAIFMIVGTLAGLILLYSFPIFLVFSIWNDIIFYIILVLYAIFMIAFVAFIYINFEKIILLIKKSFSYRRFVEKYDYRRV